MGAEIRSPPHSLHELGGAEKQSNRDLSVPSQVRARQACPPVLSSVLSGEPVQMFKHRVKSFLPKATEISDHTASRITHSCFSQSQSTLRHLKENSFCVLLGKYGQKRKKKKKIEIHYRKMKKSSYLMALFRLCRALESEKAPEFVSLYLVNTGMKCV